MTKYRGLKASSDKELALMQQELKHKDIELRELQERYAGIGELYQITVDAINKSDQSDSILAMLQK